MKMTALKKLIFKIKSVRIKRGRVARNFVGIDKGGSSLKV